MSKKQWVPPKLPPPIADEDSVTKTEASCTDYSKEQEKQIGTGDKHIHELESLEFSGTGNAVRSKP